MKKVCHISNNAGYRRDTQRWLSGGKELLTEFGVNEYDFEARRLVPLTGRFKQPDLLAGKYPWLSPYAYCGADPVNFIDPTGLEVSFNGSFEDMQFAAEQLNLAFKDDVFYIKDGKLQVRERENKLIKENISTLDRIPMFKQIINQDNSVQINFAYGRNDIYVADYVTATVDMQDVIMLAKIKINISW